MQSKLIYELANKEYVSSKVLCNILEISSKELKKQVDLINLIDHSKFHIDSKTSKGYCLITKYSISEVVEMLDIDLRLDINDIIELQYLLNKDYQKIDNIALECFVSYSKVYSVYQSLKLVYSFESEKSLGQKIVIDDLERKQAIGNVVSKYVKSIDISKDLIYIFKQFDLEYENYIRDAIQILNDKRINIKSNMYVKCLVICVLDISDSSRELISEVDHIFGYKLSDSSNKFWSNFIFKEIVPIAIDLNFLLDEIHRNFSIKLKYSNSDFIQLERHLEELQARVANGIVVSNQDFDKLNDDFELKYPLASEISHYAIKHFYEEYNIELPNIERLYLAIHFQKLLSNANEKVKIIIVCEYGYAMSSLIANEIMMNLSDVEILCIKSLNDFQANLEMYINQVDIIVTTLDSMQIEDVTVVSMSNYEIDNSISIIKEAKKRVLTNRFFSQVITYTDNVKIKGSSRTEILENLEDYCITNNLCSNLYIESAIKRELKGNVVQNKIVYLHGNNNYVQVNSIIAVEFENDVDWLGKPANSMFIVLIKVDALNTFNKQVSSLYKLTMKKEFIESPTKKKLEVLKARINE